MTVIRDASDWQRLSGNIDQRDAWPWGLLLGQPTDFDVIDVRNPHMAGMEGTVDTPGAHRQWQQLARVASDHGLEIEVLPSSGNLVDLVFTANPSFTGVDGNGDAVAVCGRMSHPQRRAETALHARALGDLGHRLIEIPPEVEGRWEGNGDTLWHRGLALMWCGIGSRSSESCHLAVAEELAAATALLQLVDEDFYHLDTALAVIDEETAAYIPCAFNSTGVALIEAAFARTIVVDEEEGCPPCTTMSCDLTFARECVRCSNALVMKPKFATTKLVTMAMKKT